MDIRTAADVLAVKNSPGWERIALEATNIINNLAKEVMACKGTDEEKLSALAKAQGAQEFWYYLQEQVLDMSQISRQSYHPLEII